MLGFKYWLLICAVAISSFVKAEVPGELLGPPRAMKPGTSADDEVKPTVTIKAPKFGKPATAIKVEADSEIKEGDVVFWMVLKGDVILGNENVYELPNKQGIILVGEKAPVPYRVLFMFARGGVQQAPILAEIQIGDPAPVPPVPVDPVDPPKPNPVEPPVVALPIRALFILEEEKITKELSDAVNSADMRAWMNSNALKNEEGRAEYRVWDDDLTDEQILVHHTKSWVEAFHKAKNDRAAAGKQDDDPWMMITNEKAGGSLSIPLPRERLYDYLNKCRQGNFKGN